jgi:hypothetical protein
LAIDSLLSCISVVEIFKCVFVCLISILG